MKKILGFALCLALILGAVAGCGNAAKEYQKEAIALYNDGIDFFNEVNSALETAGSEKDVQAIDVKVKEFQANFQTKTTALQQKYAGKVDPASVISDDLTTAAKGLADLSQEFSTALKTKTAELAETK